MDGLKLPIAMSVLALTLAAPSLRAASEPQIRQSGNISYVSGGVSEEGRDSLLALAPGFNLKLVLATRSGAYLSNVDIVIKDGRGQRMLDAKADGPWFYAKVPNGTYEVAASANGTTVRKLVTIETRSQNKVDFRWDD
jgi:hypothetical protein